MMSGCKVNALFKTIIRMNAEKMENSEVKQTLTDKLNKTEQ